MKAADFSAALRALALTTRQIGADGAGRRIETLASAFAGSGQVGELLTVALPEGASSSSDAPRLTALLEDLALAEPLILRIAKPSFVKDWKALVSLLRQNQNMTIRDFVAALQGAFSKKEPYPRSGESLVDAFVRRLTETQHNASEFCLVVAALESAREINQEEMARVASRFAFKTARSTPRKTSLARIRRRGDSSESAGAKDRATKGKSAA